jgi:predicted metalloprotease with PDZ domain
MKIGEPAGSPSWFRASRRYALLSFVVLGLSLLLAGGAKAGITYNVSLAHPEEHLFHVQMEIPDVQHEVTLQMAAWNALYQVRDFSSHVQQVQAFANGQPARIEKLDKLTWQVHGTGAITVKYDTFWDDVGPFNSQLNAEHAFVNPAMILFYVPDRRAEAVSVFLKEVPANWGIASATTWLITQAGGIRLISLQAPGFDALADGPIELSAFEQFTIHDVAPPVRVVIHGDNYKKSDVENALRKIVLYEIKMMEGAPYSQYVFIFHIGKAAAGGGGGMEHANCTAIFVPSGDFVGNVSAHEFFHLWNVKRIRPITLEPVDYTREMYTRALWFAEGVTNTYGAYAMIRSGLWNREEFYQDLSAQVTELETRPAERWQSAEQSSLDTWLDKYALYNQPQRSVSYYTKGQILGVLLDIVMREQTDNQRSLDDLLRAMNQDFAKAGRFYRDSLDVRLTAEKIAGASLEDFFAKYVSDAQPLPYADLFAKAGLALQKRDISRTTLGFSLQREPNGPWTVASVEPGGNAEKAGLQSGDEIVRWNNGDVPRRPERWAYQQKPGEVVHLRIRRTEKEQTMDIRLGEIRETYFEVSESPGATDRAKRIREGMLHGTTDPITARAR